MTKGLFLPLWPECSAQVLLLLVDPGPHLYSSLQCAVGGLLAPLQCRLGVNIRPAHFAFLSADFQINLLLNKDLIKGRNLRFSTNKFS